MFLERTGIEVRLFLFFHPSLSLLYFFKKKGMKVVTVLPKLLY